MDRRPSIGITWGARPIHKFIPYQLAVERSGGTVVRIDAGAQPPVGGSLDQIDAILFPGGGDVHPRHYGDRELHPSVEAEDQLDELELALARDAKERGIPIFGICRGMQMLNVAAGGSLIQDLITGGYNQLDHRQYHAIEVEPSHLEEVVEARSVQVNSRHHQAIRELGRDLQITARSSDGVIEGVESDDGLLLAVQCHPEDMVEQEWTQRLFQRFIALASVRHRDSRRAGRVIHKGPPLTAR